MNVNRLIHFLEERKESGYRAMQVKQAFILSLNESWEGVTPWPKALREEAVKLIPWDELTCKQILEGETHHAVKFLFECRDGAFIETVIMRHEDGRNTVCVSSQVGCPMACSFCATGKMGFKRNLTAEEIFEQVIHAARWLKKVEKKVTNVVYMGMGEPMHNYDEVMRSVRLLNDPEGFNLGARHISISTCGIVPGILKLADEPEQVNLAISLHAAIANVRSKIMPVNAAYPIDALMDAVRTYAKKTNRKVMFEYLLLKGVNDSHEDADALADLLEENHRLYHVNLIKYHDTDVYTASNSDVRHAFLGWLHDRGVSATQRQSFGEDIHAACGQLATGAS